MSPVVRCAKRRGVPSHQVKPAGSRSPPKQTKPLLKQASLPVTPPQLSLLKTTYVSEKMQVRTAEIEEKEAELRAIMQEIQQNRVDRSKKLKEPVKPLVDSRISPSAPLQQRGDTENKQEENSSTTEHKKQQSGFFPLKQSSVEMQEYLEEIEVPYPVVCEVFALVQSDILTTTSVLQQQERSD